MKYLRKILAVGLSLLLLLPSSLIPWVASAEESPILAEFKYAEDKVTEIGTDSKSGSSISNGVRFYLKAPIDLTPFGASAPPVAGAAITAPDIYLQADMQVDTKGNTINLLFLQPHSASSLMNNCASNEEINAVSKAGGWYTVSIPLSSMNNNDGIDLTDIQYMAYFVQATGSVDVQVKNLRIVKMTESDIRTELNALFTADQPTDKEYVSVDAYNAALAAAKAVYDNHAATGDALMTAWNVLTAAKNGLEPLPQGIDKTALSAALNEERPVGNFHRDALNAYDIAKAAGQQVCDNPKATQVDVDHAVKAIEDAKAALYDIAYIVAEFPAVSGADENGLFTWENVNGAVNFGTSALTEPVDMAAHDPSKLRFQVDMRLIQGDAASLTQLTLQPRDIDGKMENAWDKSLKEVMGDGEWHTFERDFSLNQIYENWHIIKTASMHLQTTDAVTLEVKRFRVVDVTLQDDKSALADLVKTNVGDAALYPENVWQSYQDALNAAQSAIDTATDCQTVWQAQDTLQAALHQLGNRGILMEAINEPLPADKTYSDASLAVYEAAKTAARTLLQNSDATNEQLEEALQTLKNAKAALVETTFLAGEFPMTDRAPATNGNGTSSVTGGVYRYEGKMVHVDSPVGFAGQKPDLLTHDISKLYMQFDILFEEQPSSPFQAFYVRPATADGKAILNHHATEHVNAVSDKVNQWHTISVPMLADTNWNEIAGMSFYMLGADQTATYKLQVKNMRIVDLSAEPVLNTLFADGMMFQQNKTIAVFGQGGNGHTVTVTLYKDGTDTIVATETVTTDKNGNWKAELLKDVGLKGGYDTYTLTVKGDAITHIYRHILIGEVWVAGGQSNMEYHIQNDVNNTSILEKTDEYIRIFYEPSLIYGNGVDQPLTPQFNVTNAVWADGTNVNRLKSASSVAYNFALQLRKELDVPVGFLNTPLGGTYIEAWISREAIENSETVKSYLQSRNRYYNDENWPQEFNRMSALYNQKIGALCGYHVAGMLWYQGETNLQSGDIDIYTDMLELLQQDWSRVFGFENEEIPMIYAHIAPHVYGSNTHSQATVMAYFWEAMSDAWAAHPQSMAQIPIYDLPLTHYFVNLNGGNQSNGPIHPADKIPVGQRMATAAMNLVYSGGEAFSAPVYKSMTVADGKIRLTFDQVGSGLAIKDNAPTLHGFAIAGADGIYVDANARIVSADTIEVWNERVSNPQNVTYAFSSFNMAANLQNKAGMAAAPFRTARDTVEDNLYVPKDWQFADGETWIVTGHSDTTKWESLWQSDKATLTYDTAIKAEGTASLKAAYTGGSIGIGPVYGQNSVINQFQLFPYLTIRIKNPDNREKTVKLQFTYGNTVYTAALADQDAALPLQTRATLPANSDFNPYAFSLMQLVDVRGNAVTDMSTVNGILKNASKMEWVITDPIEGTLYLDDVQFGREVLTSGSSTDTSILKQAIADAESLNLAYFSAETVETMQQALAIAKNVLTDVSSTQEQIDDAAAVLQKSIDALVPIYFAGDIDGDGYVTASDALMALQAATSKITLTDIQKGAANVDRAGDVTANDALLVLQFATKKISSF